MRKKEATFAIHTDKTPGPDGFSASFFQSMGDGGSGGNSRDQDVFLLMPSTYINQ